jgi:pimeloyl-ACP methyl ester carboxylesterase
VHVVESGDGPPVVHLHGNNTSSLSHLMLLEHSTGVRTCLVDRPGFGLSDPEDFPRTAFRQRAVALVEAVLDALDLESAFLVGASGGGSWAVWTALDRPARVRGVVMLGSVPLLPGARIPVPIRLMATPVLGALVARVVKPGRSMRGGRTTRWLATRSTRAFDARSSDLLRAISRTSAFDGSLVTSRPRAVVSILFWSTGPSALHIPSGARGESSTGVNRADRARVVSQRPFTSMTSQCEATLIVCVRTGPGMKNTLR